ncbi:MAG: DUF3159 domain-containing protein [Actinomycetes bacterium]
MSAGQERRDGRTSDEHLQHKERAVAGPASALGGDFSLQEAIGGWRGLIESALPGVVFVTAFIVVGGFRVPVIAALATVAVLVVARLVQRTPVTQALSGVFGVVLGAIWAWRVGEARGYFVPGLWLTGALTAAVIVSMIVRWPAVGIVVGLVRGWGSRWRGNPAAMRRFHLATAIYAVSQVIRLGVQVPLYLANATAALGVAKLALGAPYFALTLWVMWLLVRRVELSPAPQRQPQQRR